MQWRSIGSAVGEAARFWHWLGWIEDHVGRLYLLIAVVGIVLTGGAVLIAWAERSSSLVVYLVAIFVPLALSTLGIWTAVGVRAWRSPLPQNPIPSQDDQKEGEERPTKLRILPIQSGNRATLRVENEGGPTTVAMRMLRIDENASHPSYPYRMKWEPLPKGDQWFSVTASTPQDPSQIAMRPGEYRSVEVARAEYGYDDDDHRVLTALNFPWPGDISIERAVDAEDEIEVEIDFNSNPKPTKPWRQTYVIGVEDGKIARFEEISESRSQT